MDRDFFMALAHDLIDSGNFSEDELADLLIEKDALEKQVSLPEAAASITGFMITPGGWEFQVTRRGATLDQAWGEMYEFVQSRLREGFTTRVQAGSPKQAETKPQSTTTATTTTAKQEVTPSRETPSDLVFKVDKLEATVSSGKTYWKAKGGPFSQFGVTVWPEVLEQAGLDLNPMKVYNMAEQGWKAEYVLNDKGKPSKVTRLFT